ncbi:MAG: hypothetical protein KA319_03960 [Ferruginibacter sp.]|nr:hypothetical protein [Ferruginibacter sp.]
MEALVIQPQDTEQLKAIKSILKALKVDFKTAKENEFYSPQFLTKIKESRKQAKQGKITYIKTKDLWK